jgi:hypothetical protein
VIPSSSSSSSCCWQQIILMQRKGTTTHRTKGPLKTTPRLDANHCNDPLNECCCGNVEEVPWAQFNSFGRNNLVLLYYFPHPIGPFGWLVVVLYGSVETANFRDNFLPLIVVISSLHIPISGGSKKHICKNPLAKKSLPPPILFKSFLFPYVLLHYFPSLKIFHLTKLAKTLSREISMKY